MRSLILFLGLFSFPAFCFIVLLLKDVQSSYSFPVTGYLKVKTFQSSDCTNPTLVDILAFGLCLPSYNKTESFVNFASVSNGMLTVVQHTYNESLVCTGPNSLTIPTIIINGTI